MKIIHLQRFIEGGLAGPLRASPSIARAKPALEVVSPPRIWTILIAPANGAWNG
jgi:hypothetical protein